MSLPGAGRAGQAGTSAGTVWERRADGHHRFFSQFTIPVADSAFSAVVAGFYLPQMADPAAATAELARALAPGGWLAVSVWDVPARARRTGLLADTIADVTGAPPASAAVSAGRLRELIGAAGLGLAECSTLRWVHPVPAPRPSGMGCSPARWPPQLLSCASHPPPSTASANGS